LYKENSASIDGSLAKIRAIQFVVALPPLQDADLCSSATWTIENAMKNVLITKGISVFIRLSADLFSLVHQETFLMCSLKSAKKSLNLLSDFCSLILKIRPRIFSGPFFLCAEINFFAGKGWLYKSEQDEMGRVVSMNHPPGCLRWKCKSFLEGWRKVGTFCMVSSSTRTEKVSGLGN
jgi:hypothetical protein